MIWIGGRLWQVVASERWSHMEARLYPKWQPQPARGLDRPGPGRTARPELMSAELFNLRLGPILATSR